MPILELYFGTRREPIHTYFGKQYGRHVEITNSIDKNLNKYISQTTSSKVAER
ncbi:MAG: hypothetical protein ACI9JM_002379 [Halioglobus sp.]